MDDDNGKKMLALTAKVQARLEEISQKMGGGSVSIGFMEGAPYPDGTPVAAVAFWNEFGHGGPFPAPPRPFFRNMIADHQKEWPAQMAAQAKGTDYDGPKVLGSMGQVIKGELEQSINDLDSPELSDTTIMLREKYGNNPQDIRARDVLAAQELVKDGFKGTGGTSAKPLIWTAHMKDSITFKVNS